MGKQSLPLEGLKVLDLTTVVMGPFATQVLGDFGADIIKIEEPNGDLTRVIGPSRNPGMSSLYLGSNRNKKSIVLDLKRKEPKEALWKLIEEADIFVHNIRPQKIANLGFDPNSVMKKNSKIIYVGLHGYREEGPYGGQPAFDDVIQGQSGIAGAFQVRDEVPNLAPTIVADKSIALLASTGLLAAYIQRLKKGKGSYLEVSMFEGMVGYTMIEHHAGEAFVPPIDKAGYSRVLSPYRIPHKTKDGYVCILPYTDKQWKNFWKIVQRLDYSLDKRFLSIKARSENISALYKIIGEIVIEIETKDLVTLLGKAEIPCGAVNRLEDLKNDPHLKAIEFFRNFEHPTEGLLQVPDSAFRFNKEELPIRYHQPNLGENSKEILREAGFSDLEIDKILNNK